MTVRLFSNSPGLVIRNARPGFLPGALLWLAVSLPAANAVAGPLEDGRKDLRVEEIITTGMRDTPLAQLPRSANIITADDIALLPSSNIVDLLAREANLNLRSTLGNAKFSGVDIRGQGDTYSSNVQVLVDGIRLNAADLSGADYSSVPLDQIDRVEVIRGANSVRYGNGAVGGVVNIITKDATPGTRINAQARAGSYSTVDSALGGAWANEQFSLGGDVSYSDSDGYRDNSGLETRDFSAVLGYTPVDWAKLGLRGQAHRDEYGLPGPVGKDEDPRSASSLFDGGQTDDDRVALTVALGNDQTGVLSMIGSTRDRENRYNIGITQPVPEPDVILQDDVRFEAVYDKTVALAQRSLDLTFGLDLLQTDYTREQFDQTGAFNNSKVGDIRETGWFAAADFAVTESTTLSLGYRDDDFSVTGGTYIVDCDPADKTDFDGLIPTPICPDDAPVFLQPDSNGTSTRSWRNNALEAGLVFTPSDTSSWFVSYAQSFRNPNVDELIVADDDLGPQTGDHVDAGVRLRFGSAVEWNLAAFYNRTKNEILFGLNPDDNTPVNRNADEPTKRTGGETDVRWYALQSLTLTANLGYTNARFTGSGTTVPLVPKLTGALGAQWQPVASLIWTVAGNYVGERYDGNDFQNVQPKLDDYTVFDTRLSYELGGVQFYGGINNLFDEVYAASVFSNQYYPMPDRNYYAGVAYRLNK